MIGVLHTTESDPGTGPAVVRYLQAIGAEPHFVVDPSDGYVVQLVPADTYAKALTNLPGGVETNRRIGGVLQVEIVGRAADVGGYDDAWYDVLRRVLQDLSDRFGIFYEFRPDPARLTFEQWLDPDLRGWLGHCHVPENDHWDPGTLDYARLLLHDPETPDMTPDDIRNGKLTDGSTINDRLIWTNEEAKRAANAATTAAAQAERAAAAAERAVALALVPQASDASPLSAYSVAELLAELQRRL